ncbi:MAG: DUF445 domain-containing protein [Parachlamydiales bacterium]
MIGTYIAIPIVTALIGWLTNVIAVKMLFHPREPIRCFGLLLQGVIPKRREVLAHSLADLFDRELVTKNELLQKLEGIEIEEEVEKLIQERSHGFIEGMKKQMPMLSMFLSDSVLEKVAEDLKDELVKVLPDIKKRVGRHVERELDLKTMIQEKIASFSVQKMERIIMKVATRELRAIELLGGLLGLIIGLIQVAVMTAFL